VAGGRVVVWSVKWCSSSSSSKSAVGSGTARGSDDVPHAAEKSEQLNR
jgi:hypothetical protein